LAFSTSFNIPKTALPEQQLNPLYFQLPTLITLCQLAKFNVRQQDSIERVIGIRMKHANNLDWQRPEGTKQNS
jgi:hypothetical protein